MKIGKKIYNFSPNEIMFEHELNMYLIGLQIYMR